MRTYRRALGVGFALIVVIFAVSIGSASPTPADAAIAHSSSQPSSLRVSVKDLPRALLARVIVTGPHSYRRLLHGSATLRKLRVGTYRIVARPVVSAAGSYRPVTPTELVPVRARHSSVATVDYADLVPGTTKPVPTAATQSITGPATGDRVLKLSRSAGATLAVGDILASGSTVADPEGYLVKVTKIVSASGGTTIVDVEPATLMEAIPEGELNLNASLSSGSIGPRLSHVIRSFYQQDYPNKFFTCSTTANFSIDPSFGVDPTISLHIRWGFFKVESASFTVSVKETTTLAANGDAGATCSTSGDGIALLSGVRLANVPFDVAGIPGVVEATLGVYLSGDATTSAQVSAGVRQSATASAGLTYANGSFSPESGFSNSFSQSFSAAGDATAESWLTPTIDLQLDGLAGPDVDIAGGLKFDAATDQDPWWTLQGCLRAGVGFTIDVLGWSKSWADDSVFEQCKPLASANGGFAGTPTTTTTTTTPTTTTTTTSGPPPNPGSPSPATTTWQTQASYPAEPGVTTVACPSTTDCYAAGSNSSGGADVLATTNSGATWSTLTLPAGSGGPIACPATTTCYLAGADASGNPVVFVTTDGGSTWTSDDLPAGFETASMACPSTTSCYLVGYSSSTQSYGAVATTDSGVSWAAQSLPTDTYFASGGGTGILSCPSTTTCYLAAIDLTGTGTVIGTTNSGASWSDETTGTGFGSDLYAVTCPSTTTCYATGYESDFSRVAVTTTDGGSTWTPVTAPSNGGYITECSSTTTCYATNGGGIDVTTNGGSTWGARRRLPASPGS